MPISSTLFLALAGLAVATPVPSQLEERYTRQDNPNNCSRFAVDGNDDLFTHYRFYDFRDVYGTEAKSANVGPPVYGQLPIHKKTHDSFQWILDYTPRNRFSQRDAPQLSLNYTSSRVYIEKLTNDSMANTQLTLFTERPTDPRNINEQWCSAVDYTEMSITALSWRIMARINGEAGAVSGFFTYLNDYQESDIEIKTNNQGQVSSRDPMPEPGNMIHFATQPDTRPASRRPGTSVDVDAAPGDWNYWTELRMDWLPGATSAESGSRTATPRMLWWVNGTLFTDTTLSVPNVASKVVINMWSNGGPFTGKMEPGKNATLNVAWIEMALNRTRGVMVSPLADSIICLVDSKNSLGGPLPQSS